MRNEITREWWRQHFKKYQESNPFSGKNKARKEEWNAIYEAFDINNRLYPRLVDFGCGTGRIALKFIKENHEVTGIDISGEALEIIKKRARRYRLSKKLRTIQSDLYNPIKKLDGSFDGGYMIVTYHCISNKPEEQKKVFKNFVRLVRRKGKILVMEPNPLHLLFYIFYPFIYKSNWREGFNIVNSRKEVLVNLLREAGTNDIKIFYHSFLPRSFINNWGFIREINRFLCSIPLIKNFAAYHIITAVKK